MNDTNEEVFQKLKQAVCDYYMGYVKQKLSNLLVGSKENELENQILQFLDTVGFTGNSVITRDAIIRILENVLLEDYSDSFNSELEKIRISYTFPNVATVNIENRTSCISY